MHSLCQCCGDRQQLCSGAQTVTFWGNIPITTSCDHHKTPAEVAEQLGQRLRGEDDDTHLLYTSALCWMEVIKQSEFVSHLLPLLVASFRGRHSKSPAFISSVFHLLHPHLAHQPSVCPPSLHHRSYLQSTSFSPD